MALGRYSRVDNRRQSSNYCPTATVVVVVALCFVGVWMMTSTSVVQVENVKNNNEVKDQTADISGGIPKQFEDNQVDLPVDPKRDERDGDNSEQPTKDVEKPEEKNKEEEPERLQEKSEEKEENIEEKNKEKIEEKAEVNSEEKEENAEEKNKEKMEEKHEADSEEKSVEKLEENVEEKNKEKMEAKSEVDSEDRSGEKTEDKSEDNHDIVDDQKHNALDSKTRPEELTHKDDSVSSQEEDHSLKTLTDRNGTDGKSTNGLDSKEKSGVLDVESDTSEKGMMKSDDDSTGNNTNLDEAGKKVVTNDTKVDQNGSAKAPPPPEKATNQSFPEDFTSGAQSDLLTESSTRNGAWSTQAAESKNEKEAQLSYNQHENYKWKLCNVTAGPDYIPCLDNLQAIRSLRTTKHYEHRERHCPEESPACLVSLPKGYKTPIGWPTSREKIWYTNVPHTKLAEIKGHQNWVKVSGEFLTFPGGGTQFKHGALHYIDFIQESFPEIAWGNRSRVVLDVGCGVASFGGYLFDRDTITMSFAPKDEHEAQVQFALERGIPAISAVMGTKRLPFPGMVFDVVHCARCRVPWHIEGGKLLLELNRLLRPGGFFVWSATPVYQKLPEDVEIWDAMAELTKSLCWDVVSIVKDQVDKVGIAIYRKPMSNECYEKRANQTPPVCKSSDDPNAVWNVPLQSCVHKVPVDQLERGSRWPELWPARLNKVPYWMLSSQSGIYGRSEPEDFVADYEHWNRVVTKSYVNGMGINWSSVRNVMDMRAIYGGFAAALKEMGVWVMNVVSINSPDTLPIIFERGLLGIYHDWCESFSTYPRSYDVLHADHLFSKVKKRCKMIGIVAEVDRVLRPKGYLIVRDNVETINELVNLVKPMQWDIKMTYSKDKEGLLCVQKSFWRPTESEAVTYAIA